MAKKEEKSILGKVQSAFTRNEQTQEQTQTVEKTETEKPKRAVIASGYTDWELKDRTYFLKRGNKPLSYIIKSANIHYFDEEKGYERELKYCSNQRTVFVDEMKGDQRLDHIIFRAGVLLVPREKVILQKLLTLYHPHRNKLFREHKPVEDAISQLDWLEFETEALIAAKNLDIEMAEAVMRAENGSKVAELSSKELKRDLLLFAKKNPRLFLELAADDNVMLRNFGIKATEARIINLSSDQRTFTWATNDRKLLNVPYDEHPYSALAAWFKTDEGMEIYSNIEKRLDQ
jgi:hypothetical protein